MKNDVYSKKRYNKYSLCVSGELKHNAFLSILDAILDEIESFIYNYFNILFMTTKMFAAVNDPSRKICIPFGSILEITSSYEIPGTKTKKRLNSIFILHQDLTKKRGVLVDIPESEGIALKKFNQTDDTFTDFLKDYKSVPETYDLTEDEYNLLDNFFTEENEGMLIITKNKLIEILDSFFYKKIRSIQHRSVIWRKATMKISFPYSNDDKYTKMGKITTFYKKLSFKAGDMCFGEITDSKIIYLNPFVLDVYLNDLNEEMIDKPNRVFVSGTSFESRDVFYNNKNVDSFKEAILNGITVIGNLKFIYVAKAGNYLRSAASISIEGFVKKSNLKKENLDYDVNELDLRV